MAKILLVEDDKSLREIYGVRLMAEGYEIVSAGDGEEALAMAIKERPDLILSDVMMPKISGFDMLDILRSTTETKDVKVIMMTALSSEDQRARGEALGADRYLVKSQVGIEDVVRTVHDVLGDSVASAAPAPAFTPAPQPVATPAPEPAPYTAPVPEAPVYAAPPVAAPAPAPAEQPFAPVEAPAAFTEPIAPAYTQPSVPTPIAEPMQPQAPVTPVYTAPEPAPYTAPVPEAPVYAAPPVAAPAPAPFTPPTPAPTAEPFAMPQPTAPFSTPAPASVGERVIAPLTDPSLSNGTVDISSQMEQALNNSGFPPSAGTPPAAQ